MVEERDYKDNDWQKVIDVDLSTHLPISEKTPEGREMSKVFVSEEEMKRRREERFYLP